MYKVTATIHSEKPPSENLYNDHRYHILDPHRYSRHRFAQIM